MKKLLYAVALLPALVFGQVANDLIWTQRKPDNSGNIQRNVSPTANAALGVDANKLPVALTAFTQDSATGAAAVTASGTNQNITLTPSGTGAVRVGTTGIEFGSTTPGSISGASGTVTIAGGTGTSSNINLLPTGTGLVDMTRTTNNAVWRIYGNGATLYTYFTTKTDNSSMDFGMGGSNVADANFRGYYFFNAGSNFNGWKWFNNATIAATLTPAGKFTTYNGLATAGNGVVSVQGAGRATAQTAANASVATYTVGAADASFNVSANVRVTTSSAEAFTVTCAYTDEGNTARTITLNFQLVAGTIGTAIAAANGAVPYEGIPLHIRAKAATAITIATTGTFTGCTYNVEGVITKLQ